MQLGILWCDNSITSLVAGVLKANDLREVHVCAEGGAEPLLVFHHWLSPEWCSWWGQGKEGTSAEEARSIAKVTADRGPLLRGLPSLEP